MAPRWTVLTVNYRSSDYFPAQLKLLYEHNDPATFQLLIYDNSRPHERDILESLTAPYKAAHNNVNVIYYSPSATAASEQHGEAASHALKTIETPYLLLHDPDFFWVRPNYLDILARELEQGRVAVGAPYLGPVGIGHPKFPWVIGCAYKTAALKEAGVDFTADVNDETLARSAKDFPPEKFHFSYDTGWKVRAALSDKPFLAFEDSFAAELVAIMGRHSFESLPHEYYLHGKTIAFHIYRGSITDTPKDKLYIDPATLDPTLTLPPTRKAARLRYAAFFVELMEGRGGYSLKGERLLWRRLITPLFWKVFRDSKLQDIKKPAKLRRLLGSLFFRLCRWRYQRQ
ncbi:MAG: hypothetical protein LW855_00790 [Alphaproteobacteria bacterium]|jgi:hypothetical protein|nr:hypothetical protein [Thalassospira sp.]MCE2964317.1 hypothetical protein [Alphaproteobacteria bacterium]